MEAVQHYIDELDPVPGAIMHQLHLSLLNNPGVVAKIRYRVPFYFRKSWFCYLNPIKQNGVELAFIRGRELSNQEGILLAKDRKMVRGIELFRADDIPWESVNSIIQEALILDETIPYSIRKSKPKK